MNNKRYSLLIQHCFSYMNCGLLFCKRISNHHNSYIALVFYYFVKQTKKLNSNKSSHNLLLQFYNREL